MAVKWYIVAEYSNGETAGWKISSDIGLEAALEGVIKAGMKLHKVELLEPEKTPDYPPVPSPEETERERMRAEWEAEQPPEWLDRSDDYNVFEEQQVFLDNEGGE